VGSERRRSPECAATSEMRREPSFYLDRPRLAARSPQPIIVAVYDVHAAFRDRSEIYRALPADAQPINSLRGTSRFTRPSRAASPESIKRALSSRSIAWT
jgi:hypothetical protein